MRVDHDAESQRWDVSWGNILLRLRLADGVLVCEHFGPLDRLTPPTQGHYLDPIWLTRAAVVQLGPDDRGIAWSSAAWSQPDPAAFVLTLDGANQPLRAELYFAADDETGLLHRRTTLVHTGGGSPLEIAHAGSVAAMLPADVTDVVHLAGRWGAETQVQQVPLLGTALLLESRAGKTGFDFAPYLALRSPTHTYLCELLWSGNWQLHVRRRPDGLVTLAGGLNEWGLRHRLHEGQRLDLPDALLACVPGDLNAATQRLHDYQRRYLRPDPERAIPVQFNSWYPYQGEPPVARMKVFVDAAAGLGCEVFVLDAGWYTTETEDPSQNWWTRTGDWVVNPRLFPNGLEELSGYCRERSLGFGIWFEPEAISPSGVVHRAHPEWLHVVPGSPQPRAGRGTLNLGVPEARAFARERVLAVLRATGATWMKWDFNTDLLQGGWAPGLPEELTDQDPLIAHYRGLYRVQDEIRAAIPGLTLEMCAGGGGRFDPAILSHAHTNWMSDQTQALQNLAIHFGSQLAHCPIECNDWLIEWPPHDGLNGRQWVDDRGDLAFRTRIAMLGTFGISAPVEQWTEEDAAVVQTHVAWYKHRVRPLVHDGDQYLLTGPPPLDGEGDWAAVWYASKDRSRGILFAFRLAGEGAQHVFPLPGLLPEARYLLETPEGRWDEWVGADLMSGLAVIAGHPFRSVLVAVEQAVG